MDAHAREFRLVAMCRVLGVQRSGYYAWLRHGASARELEDQRLLGLIKHHWLASGTVYGYRKITTDLRDLGERCGKHRVYRLMRVEGLRSQTGYRRRAGGMASQLLWLRNSWRNSSTSKHRTKPGSPTSPTFAPMKAGFIWRASRICSVANWSATPCRIA